MRGSAMQSKARIPSRGSLLPVLILLAALSIFALSGRGGERAWLSSGEPQKHSPTRRSLLKESVVGASALWLAEPEDAIAFRSDRILNGKSSIVPKIRARYQKLEGLRDDINLVIQKDAERFVFQARPAEWYSGLGSSLDGPLSFAGLGEQRFGCNPFTVEAGTVVLLIRGRCTFGKKMKYAKESGAKSVIMLDEKMSKLPFTQQNLTGLVRSKGVSVRAAGDALTGASSVPYERGITVMSNNPLDDPKPELDAAMVNIANGTVLFGAVKSGEKIKVLDVQRFKFEDNIDKYIKKDLPKLLKDMQSYGLLQRIAKDDLFDPIIKILEKLQNNFEEAVKSKNYGEIRRTFKAWNEKLDNLGQWDLAETF